MVSSIDSQSGTDSVQLPVLLGKLSSGLEIAAGLITAGDLLPRVEIAHRDFVRDAGYQRLPAPARVNELGRDLIAGRVDLPTAILLNLRDYSRDRNLHFDENGQTSLCLGGEKLWAVDGQHRCAGLKKAFESEPDRFRDYSIPFILGLGWDTIEEMRQFYIVNTNAKSVPTSLAFDLLHKLGRIVPGLNDQIEEKGRSWMTLGQTLTEELSAKSNVWKNRIQFSNQPKGATTVPSAGFVNSLRPIIVGSRYFNLLDANLQRQVLNAYWEGLRGILPSIFENPTQFVLQKSLGVQVMHSIFIDVLEVVRNRQESVKDPQSYARVLREPLMALEAPTSEGVHVAGEDFWYTAPRGAAGGFSSSGGRRMLTAWLRAGLPKITEV